MQNVSAAQAATESLPQLFEKARFTPQVVSDGTDDLGAIISMKDFEALRTFHNTQLLESMKALGESMRLEAEERGISLEDLEKMLAKTSISRASA